MSGDHRMDDRRTIWHRIRRRVTGVGRCHVDRLFLARDRDTQCPTGVETGLVIATTKIDVGDQEMAPGMKLDYFHTVCGHWRKPLLDRVAPRPVELESIG